MAGSDDEPNKTGWMGLAVPKKKSRKHHQMVRCCSNSPKYVIVSNGIAVYLLDLKEQQHEPLTNAEFVPPLPILDTLHLSAALFKVGPHPYIIDGRHRIRTLSIAAAALTVSKPSNVLLPSKLKSKIPETKHKYNTLKFWPITEEIDGQIHIIYSALDDRRSANSRRDSTSPREIRRSANSLRDSTYPHEIINQHYYHHQQLRLPQGCVMKSHLAIGTCIHAVMGYHNHMIFDSHTCQWKKVPVNYYNGLNVHKFLSKAETNIARCVGACGEFFVVIRIEEDHTADWPLNCYENDDDQMHALACLVNSQGTVFCSLELLHFFEGPVQPYKFRRGSIFKVDQTTWAAVINAGACFNGYEVDAACDYIFIYTFVVEIPVGVAEDPNLKVKVMDWRGVHLDLEFVRTLPKGRFVYKTDAPFAAIQACFV